MGVLYLKESDVSELIDMQESISVVEEAFRQLANGSMSNVPRSRAKGPGILLHTMSASAEYLGLIGWKAYTTTKDAMRFHVAAYDAETGEMKAVIEADWLGRLRTGAATGVATRYLSRDDASTAGLIGTGLQARTQLMAICCVRQIDRVEVYSRDPERRRSFCEQLATECGTDVVPVDSSEQAVCHKDIIITATTSRKPVFRGEHLAAGAHVNAVGSNFLQKAEIDVETIRRTSRIVCDNIEQCRLEAGDFSEALEVGACDWSNMEELADVVANDRRRDAAHNQITLFKSVGLAIEDVAMAGKLIQRAESTGIGTMLPF